MINKYQFLVTYKDLPLKYKIGMSKIAVPQRYANVVKLYVDYQYLRRIKNYTNRDIGRWLKSRLADMGPSFIKIGQFMSTRKDVFGDDITDELKDLQDNVLPIPYNDLSHLLPVHKFEDIDPSPIASASIGQVHKARLKNGTVVAVKFKRPNISQNINEDFLAILALIKLMKVVSNDRKIKEFEILFNEYYNLLQEEIDFKREAGNIKLFRDMFKDTSYIKVPYVVDDCSNEEVITMEYVPSTKLTSLPAKYNHPLIATKLIECYVKQIIDYGSIHIDPHPGNTGMTSDGKIVFYDYGMVLTLDKNIKEKFNSLLLAIYEKDINTICDITMEMGLIVVEKPNIPYFKSFLISFLMYIENLDIDEFKVSYIDKANKEDMPFLVSSKFILLMRGISILEGICKTLDKDFNYKSTLDPLIQEFIVDIRYIENKMMVDLNNIRTVPDQVKLNQIQLEILDKTMRDTNNQVQSQNNKRFYITIGTIFAMFLEYKVQCPPLSMCTLMLMYLYVYK